MIALSLPPELTSREQWVLWRAEQGTKVPYRAAGYRADSTDPRSWTSFERAWELWQSHPDYFSGIGFVFTTADPYCGIDLDDCFPSDSESIAPWASGIRRRFADTYLEVSPSGHGLKIWCMASPPRSGQWPIAIEGKEVGKIEIYGSKRFFTVTGRASDEVPRVVRDHESDIQKLVSYLDRHQSAHLTTNNRIPPKIPEGQRHQVLISLAGAMWRRGMCVEAVRAALKEVNQRQCDPPHTLRHIENILRSVQQWP